MGKQSTIILNKAVFMQSFFQDICRHPYNDKITRSQMTLKSSCMFIKDLKDLRRVTIESIIPNFKYM